MPCDVDYIYFTWLVIQFFTSCLLFLYDLQCNTMMCQRKRPHTTIVHFFIIFYFILLLLFWICVRCEYLYIRNLYEFLTSCRVRIKILKNTRKMLLMCKYQVWRRWYNMQGDVLHVFVLHKSTRCTHHCVRRTLDSYNKIELKW